MSVYGGFTLRKQETIYNGCVEQLLAIMSSQLLKILQTAAGHSNSNSDGQSVNRFDDCHPYWNLLKPFRSKFNRLMMVLSEMEQHKYQPPKYSICITPLAEYLAPKESNISEITATASIQQQQSIQTKNKTYDRSLSGSSRQQNQIQVNNLLNNAVNRVTSLKTSANKQGKRRPSAAPEQKNPLTFVPQHQQQQHLLLTDSKKILQYQYKNESKESGRSSQIKNGIKQEQRQKNNHNQSFSNISSTSSNTSQPLTARKRSTENSKIQKSPQFHLETPRSGATNPSAELFSQNQPVSHRYCNQQQTELNEYPDIASLQLNTLFKQHNRDLPALEQSSQTSRKEYSSVDTESSIIFKQTNSFRLNSIRSSSRSNRKKVQEELVQGYSQNQDEIKIFKRLKNNKNKPINSDKQHYD